MNYEQRIPVRWNEEEDRILRREGNSQQVRYGSIRDWNHIAIQLPGRTNKDCRKRWSKISEAVNKGTWSPAEDHRLKQAVANFGLRWTSVATVMQTRHADQCAKRWYHHLDPALDHIEWDEDDDARLDQAVREHGRKWATIRELVFPGRSTTDVKNRHVLLERRKRQTHEEVALAHGRQMPLQPSEHQQQQEDLSFQCIDGSSWVSSSSKMTDSFDLPVTPCSQPQTFLWGSLDFDPGMMEVCSVGDSSMPAASEIDLASTSTSPVNIGSAPNITAEAYDEEETRAPIVYPDSAFGTGLDTGTFWVAASDPSTIPSNNIDKELVKRGTQHSTMVLEDLEPETVRKIISVLLESKFPVKMRLLNEDQTQNTVTSR